MTATLTLNLTDDERRALREEGVLALLVCRPMASELLLAKSAGVLKNGVIQGSARTGSQCPGRKSLPSD